MFVFNHTVVNIAKDLSFGSEFGKSEGRLVLPVSMAASSFSQFS